MNIEKLDLVHRVFLAVGPQVNKEFFKKLLLIATIFSDRETGDDLKRWEIFFVYIPMFLIFDSNRFTNDLAKNLVITFNIVF